MPKIITYKHVKECVESSGYKLLSDSYVNAKTYLDIQCPKGHEYKVTWNKWKAGDRCPFCACRVPYTYEQIRERFNEWGYKLVSTSYKKASSKLTVMCPEGHEYETSWNSFQQGNRCPFCAGNRKHSYDSVKNYFESEGYTLVSTSYKNLDSTLKTICPEGHVYNVTYSTFKRGCRCPICSNQIKRPYEEIVKMFEDDGYTVLTKEEDYKGIWYTKIHFICDKGHDGYILASNFRKGHRCRECFLSRVKIEYSTIVKAFEEEGYAVLTKEEDFINTVNTKIDYRCPNDHIGSVKWNNWAHGRRCPKCVRVQYDDMVKSFNSREYELLTSKEEVDSVSNLNDIYLRYRCPNGHEHAMKWGNWRSGNSCPFCGGVQYSDLKKSMESEEYELLTKIPYNFTFYSKDVIIYKCPKGHINSTTPYRWNYGNRCPHCQTSKGEIELREILNEMGIEYIPNDRTVIRNPVTDKMLEFDIWIPSMKKAIEFNGIYWHRDNYKDDIKIRECKRLGIDLLVITDVEWFKDKERYVDVVKSFVLKGGDAQCLQLIM
jgi:hypothetical protein